jgi:hypothetical protein
MGRMTADEVVAAYLLDRADQYDTSSPCWIALADAAKDILMGDHKQANLEGNLDDLTDRVRRIARVERVSREPPRRRPPKQEQGEG